MPAYEKLTWKTRMDYAIQIMAGMMANDRVFGPHDQDLRTSPIFDQAIMAVDMLWARVADEPDREVIAEEKAKLENLESARKLLYGIGKHNPTTQRDKLLTTAVRGLVREASDEGADIDDVLRDAETQSGLEMDEIERIEAANAKITEEDETPGGAQVVS
jgi:hypothetical protein